VGGIGIDGSDLCIISENHIIGTASGLSGIKSQNNTGASSYNVVTNNVILDNGGWGIWLFNGTSGAALYWTVTGNVVRGNTTGSIRLESGSDNNQVRANSLNGVAASDAGASNTIN
jgi:parallel beta-helix repeat protein